MSGGEAEVKKILRDLPESFWDVEVWPHGNESYVTGSLDVAQRKRVVTELTALADQPTSPVPSEREALAAVIAAERAGRSDATPCDWDYSLADVILVRGWSRAAADEVERLRAEVGRWRTLFGDEQRGMAYIEHHDAARVAADSGAVLRAGVEALVERGTLRDDAERVHEFTHPTERAHRLAALTLALLDDLRALLDAAPATEAVES